jgi:hypothetical protein
MNLIAAPDGDHKKASRVAPTRLRFLVERHAILWGQCRTRVSPWRYDAGINTVSTT